MSTWVHHRVSYRSCCSQQRLYEQWQTSIKGFSRIKIEN